jgi:hypothetical protein
MLIRRMLRANTVLAAALAVALTGTVDSGATTGTDRQLLFYNHAYTVVDRETADAIEHSEYLREFANFEVRTTTGGNMTWTGRYVYGRETYFEVFPEGELPGQDAAIGSAGLAVSAERDGDLATVTERLPEEGLPDPIPFLQTRDFGDGVRVPWFDGVNTVSTYDSFSIWGMEYRDEYFADPRGKTEPPNYPGDVGRERYLSDAYADHLLRDITGIRVGVTEFDLANNVPLLRAAGFTVRSLPDGGAVASGGGTTIRLDVVPLDQVGVRSLDLALNRFVGYQHVERIGGSTLVVGPGNRAVWVFA